MIQLSQIEALKGRLRQDFTIPTLGKDKNIIVLCPIFEDDFQTLQQALEEFELLLAQQHIN